MKYPVLWLGLASLAASPGAATSVASEGARQQHLRRAQPVVNPLLDDLDKGNTENKVAALKAKAAAAASRARSAAAQAATSEIHVEQLEMQNKMKKPDLEDSLQIATEATKSAVASSKEAVAALKETKALAKVAVADAERLAVEEVKKMLTQKYHQLETWRDKVLTNPYDRARKAGAKAAEPYYKAIQGFYKRIQEYQMEARGLMGKANAMSASANGLSGGAQGRMDGGNPIGAKQDIETAKAMSAQSGALASEAQGLQAQADNMNKMIGEYLAAGHMAAWRAEYDTDPDAIPPPPLDPDRAFTPPPVMLLQEVQR